MRGHVPQLQPHFEQFEPCPTADMSTSTGSVRIAGWLTPWCLPCVPNCRWSGGWPNRLLVMYGSFWREAQVTWRSSRWSDCWVGPVCGSETKLYERFGEDGGVKKQNPGLETKLYVVRTSLKWVGVKKCPCADSLTLNEPTIPRILRSVRAARSRAWWNVKTTSIFRSLSIT